MDYPCALCITRTQRLRNASALIGEAISGAPFPVLVATLGSEIVTANDAGCSLLGYTLSELLEREDDVLSDLVAGLGEIGERTGAQEGRRARDRDLRRLAGPSLARIVQQAAWSVVVGGGSGADAA